MVRPTEYSEILKLHEAFLKTFLKIEYGKLLIAQCQIGTETLDMRYKICGLSKAHFRGV